MTLTRIDALAGRLFDEDVWALRVKSDRLFVRLFAAQWAFAIVLALVLSPWAYAGEVRSVHPHVWTSVVIGGSLFALARAWAVRSPGSAVTRHVIAATQMLFSAVLIHVTGGRIETHFHVFGSLAFVSFYLDWRLLITATLAVAADHLLRGMMWPASVYGVANPEWWRFLEHASWVAFENVVLFLGIQRSLATIRDLAERRAALTEINHVIEQQLAARTSELEASREQYRSLVEGTQAVPWEFDPATNAARYVGPQIEALTGYGPARFEEPGFYVGIIHQDDVVRLLETMQRHVLDGSDFQLELRLNVQDGRVVHVRAIVAVVRRGADTLLRGVTFDITHQKSLEAELRESQKLESLGRMAAGVAHEINTPLQYIGDNIQFLGRATARLLAALKAVDSPRPGADDVMTRDPRIAAIIERLKLGAIESHVPHAIEATQAGLRAVEKIVGTLQHITRTHAVAGDETEVAALVRAAADEARDQWPACTFAADVELDDPRRTAEIDPDRLASVLSGLLRNAAEAAASRGTAGRVHVSVSFHDGAFAIRVRDNGSGVAADSLDRIFDPFFTTKGVGHGRGDGLHHLRDLVAACPGGRLACETTGPEGSTFLVVLRASRSREVAA